MAKICDDCGVYVVKPDGRREYASFLEVSIGELYAFNLDPEEGVLYISTSRENVEILKRQIGEISEEGADLTLLRLLHDDDINYKFEGVKRIEPFPGIAEYSYLLELEDFTLV